MNCVNVESYGVTVVSGFLLFNVVFLGPSLLIRLVRFCAVFRYMIAPQCIDSVVDNPFCGHLDV